MPALTIQCIMQSFQDLVALGIDFNNAHVQPTGEYHFHGVSAPAMAGMEYDPTQDLVHIGTNQCSTSRAGL